MFVFSQMLQMFSNTASHLYYFLPVKMLFIQAFIQHFVFVDLKNDNTIVFIFAEQFKKIISKWMMVSDDASDLHSDTLCLLVSINPSSLSKWQEHALNFN